MVVSLFLAELSVTTNGGIYLPRRGHGQCSGKDGFDTLATRDEVYQLLLYLEETCLVRCRVIISCVMNITLLNTTWIVLNMKKNKIFDNDVTEEYDGPV